MTLRTTFRSLAATLAASAVLGLALASNAHAQAYPDKPVQIIVPYAAGGPVDLTARAIAKQLQGRLKQAFVVINQAGASGNIGGNAVSHAKPDGHMLLLTADTTLAANPSLFPGRMGFDPLKDLRAVCTVVGYGQMLAVNPSFRSRPSPSSSSTRRRRT